MEQHDYDEKNDVIWNSVGEDMIFSLTRSRDGSHAKYMRDAKRNAR